jgi:Icc protein
MTIIDPKYGKVVNLNRRGFIKGAGAAGALVATAPLTHIKLAFAGKQPDINIAYISDSHIQHIKGNKFVHNWDRGLIRAVAETNLLDPQPDFVMFGGDLAQLGKREELDHGAEIMSKLKAPTKWVMGEHDYYLDLGKYWSKLFGKQYYSWDHKGVHFVTLNSILTYDDWTFKRWPNAKERMNQMAGLDNPNGSPFMVGDKQRAWLAKDLAKVKKDTPVVVFSHSPLQKLYKGWNFWTEDAEELQKMLGKFDNVNVVYGHVHQIQYNKIGNINFHSVMATAWPWPYPGSYAQAEHQMPSMTVPMNRADPFHERDATGWQLIDLHTGRPTVSYNLYNNDNRVVGPNDKTGAPEDKEWQTKKKAPQLHY